jgi:hypothetical protein
MAFGVNAIWEYQSRTVLAPGYDPTTTPPPASGWTAGGVAPFGTNTVRGVPGQTAWALNTGLWTRRNFTANGQQDLLLTCIADNRAYIYIDGTYVAKFEGSGFDFSVVIPRTMLAAGTRTIQVLGMDDGSLTYLSVVGTWLDPVLSLQPQLPVKEGVQWLTDVTTSRNGKETRRKLVDQPRQDFVFSYPANNGEQRRAFNLIYGKRGTGWMIPIWTEARYVGAVSAGVTTIPGDVSNYDFRLGEFAILWQGVDDWQIVNIQSFSSGQIVTNTLARAFTAAWLMPLRAGFMRDNPVKKFNGRESTYEIKFQIQTNFAPTAMSAPTQFLAEDLSTEQPLLSGDQSSDSIFADLDINDEDLGIITFYAPWLNNKIARTHSREAVGAAEAIALRRWLYRRQGKYKAFWQPSFEDDLRVLSTGTITTTLIVSADAYMSNNEGRKYIAVQTASGWTLATIQTSVQLDATRVQHTLTASLGIAANAIQRVCWLGLKRLNSDRIEFNWFGQGVVRVDVPILEITP